MIETGHRLHTIDNFAWHGVNFIVLSCYGRNILQNSIHYVNIRMNNYSFKS